MQCSALQATPCPLAHTLNRDETMLPFARCWCMQKESMCIHDNSPAVLKMLQAAVLQSMETPQSSSKSSLMLGRHLRQGSSCFGKHHRPCPAESHRSPGWLHWGQEKTPAPHRSNVCLGTRSASPLSVCQPLQMPVHHIVKDHSPFCHRVKKRQQCLTE